MQWIYIHINRCSIKEYVCGRLVTLGQLSSTRLRTFAMTLFVAERRTNRLNKQVIKQVTLQQTNR